MNNSDETLYIAKEKKAKFSDVLKDRGLLVVLSKKDFGKTYILDRPNIIIGRKASCNIIMDDPRVSSLHCKIESVEGGNYLITDLESTNSTFINRQKLKNSKQLVYGDRILLGSTILRFFREESI